MVSVHPAYDAMFDGQCPAHVRGDPEKRRHWAADQVRKAALVSRRLGLTEHVSFTGSLAWPYVYPWPAAPQRPRRRGLRRARPPLESASLTSSTTTASTPASRSIPARTSTTAPPSKYSSRHLNGHPRCNILYDPSHFILQQGSTISSTSTSTTTASACSMSRTPKLNPTGRQGVYGGFQSWVNRARDVPSASLATAR